MTEYCRTKTNIPTSFYLWDKTNNNNNNNQRLLLALSSLHSAAVSTQQTR